MALQDIVSVSISLQTTPVTSAGFGTSLFISDDQRFPERIRSYTSITSVADDFATTDDAYIAAQAAFAQSPAPQRIKIGRRAVDVATLTPENVAENTVYNITVTVNDGDSVTATHTALITDTAEEIATDLAADINGDANVAAHVTASVNGVGASAVLEIAPNTSSDLFFLQGEENLTIDYTATEAAADVLTAIQEEDNDFYFVAANDHTEAFVLAMAAAVEALEKIYFVSVQEAGAYATLAIPATDTLGKLAESNYFRTSGWYHHEADSKFPEMAFINIVAPFTPGTKVWGNSRVAGFGTSQNASGNALTDTQTTNLDNRNANYLITLGGVSGIAETGKVSANEWIDVIRDRDFWKARIEEGLQSLLINQPKIPYTDSGINQVRSTFRSVSDRLVTTPTQPNVLQENNPYTDNFPARSSVPLADVQNRVLNASFTGFLAGAIQAVVLTGVLTYDAMA